jgi:nuclear transport factor 2 (NTF2) superfamily protein
MEQQHPLPPFTADTAKQKIQIDEDAWNKGYPEEIALCCHADCEWGNRNIFLKGREAIVAFLKEKQTKEFAYKLKKQYWAHTENRIALYLEYEYHNKKGHWCRAYGNEHWEFDENGLITKRYASINELPIKESEKKL